VARFRLPVRTGFRVDRLSQEGGRYVLTSGSSRITAGNVVVATGAYQAPRIPAFAAELDPTIVQLHSSQYRNPSQLRVGSLLVVGAGNSGAEIALESAAGHQTWLSGRDTGQEPFRAGGPADRLFVPAFWFLLSRVLTMRTPMGRKARRLLANRGLPLARVRRTDLTRAGVTRVARVAAVRDGLPVLADGEIVRPANVVWCTGFTEDFRWIDLPILGQDGEVQHERGIVRSQPGLYVIGLFFLSAGSSSLIGGVGRDAEHIAEHIATTRQEVTVDDRGAE
jgi:putative flavoprotein involved in K+ transport